MSKIKIFLVLNSVPVLVPPIIPPKPNIPEASEITHIPSSSLYSLLSNATKVSFFFDSRFID